MIGRPCAGDRKTEKECVKKLGIKLNSQKNGISFFYNRYHNRASRLRKRQNKPGAVI